MPLLLLQNTWTITKFIQVQKFYNNTLPYDMIFTKENASTIDYQVKKLTREFNNYYRVCIWSLIYFLSTRVDLSFSLHKLEIFSWNPRKINFKGLVILLIYIRENETLGLKYYAYMKDAPLSDLLRQASINTENQLMDFSDSIWKYFSDTGRSTGAYMILTLFDRSEER